jgi:hypothetical protein
LHIAFTSILLVKTPTKAKTFLYCRGGACPCPSVIRAIANGYRKRAGASPAPTSPKIFIHGFLPLNPKKIDFIISLFLLFKNYVNYIVSETPAVIAQIN